MVKGKVMRCLYFTGGRVLSWVNRLIPKEEKRICFFCKSGINDNSEAMLSHLLEFKYQEEFEIVCIVSDPEPYRRYEKEGVRLVGLFHGLRELMRCKYIFCHGENLAIMPTKDQISVNYWHGTPLKKINRMLPKLGKYKYDFFTYITASSELFRPIFAEAFGCDPSRVLINGHPRNDYLFRVSPALLLMGIRKEEYNKVFLWMPTYRMSRDGLIQDTNGKNLENAGVPVFHTTKELEALDRFLRRYNCLLFLKLHPAQRLEKVAWGSYERIKILTNDELDRKGIRLYQILKESDALLTDYSSVFFDYLLLDRPVGFVLEDLGEYQDRRGFVFENPLDFMPGEKIYDKSQLYHFLKMCLDGRDRWGEERARVNSMVNVCKGRKNCRMLLEQIGLTRQEAGKKNERNDQTVDQTHL
ncbi:MAG TPA: CDP-glycerol glycerophosphotransferase family protein [Candidatus Blautia gallistercoris]|uniref:CDP-glycerol glycerophosphotransferase family protein n=1 Tax=Candidatus Blautia gallistercoris TaxID=2838490 RepID=A0A9D1WII1_9FIRM|nr:CDP-glycerol glycerophosphotransferase family protein [Candidatus Blautia gallistercoris]